MPRLLSQVLATVPCFLLFLHGVAASRTVYNAEDISTITLYGPTAVYLPQKCPRTVEFTARARKLPELADDKIGIFTHEIIVNGNPCRSEAVILDFAPIGPTDHYPPQWVFEDSRFHGFPVNFTCGDTSLSIRFGYFNDVSTKETDGLLSPDVVYFDFAVIPNTRPFGFCSYAGRRSDGERPLDFAPFPSRQTWESFSEARKLTHPAPPGTDDVAASPQPEESMEPQESDLPDENGKDMRLDGTQTIDENIPQHTEGPGLSRVISLEDPFRS